MPLSPPMSPIAADTQRSSLRDGATHRRLWTGGVGLAATAALYAFASSPPAMGAEGLPGGPVAFEEARAQMITPLAYGADSGRRSGATDAVRLLDDNPDTPFEELTGVLGRGESFARVLERAGVGASDRTEALGLISGFLDPSEIEGGTRLDLVLGSRSDKRSARPLDQLNFRARLDLALTIRRTESGLVAEPEHIAVDSTPMRMTGMVGNGIFASTRDAGVPSGTAREYLTVLKSAGLLDEAQANDQFDLVFEHAVAATGEVRTGKLIYAGLIRDGQKKMEQLRWNGEWYEASGVGKTKGELLRPVSVGRLSSGYGSRRHPILGYRRMHAGVDFAAPSGTPIYAAESGKVVYSGRHGGHGNYVKISHGGGLATGYAHMSRIVAGSGQSVKQGQLIGYVGSTGLSTGPHLHYEVYRGGRTINPMSVKFIERAQLSGSDLANFRARLAEVARIEPGARKMATIARPKAEKPAREIDLLARRID